MKFQLNFETPSPSSPNGNEYTSAHRVVEYAGQNRVKYLLRQASRCGQETGLEKP